VAVFIHIPAGSAVDDLLRELSTVLEPGDVIVDGGSSYWGDSIRRGPDPSVRRERQEGRVGGFPQQNLTSGWRG
jgi:6-phosphogluconate dehydrogenase (decarboxylating)